MAAEVDYGPLLSALKKIDWEMVEGLVITASEDRREPARYVLWYTEEAAKIADLMATMSDYGIGE
jgi:hypothetical protein